MNSSLKSTAIGALRRIPPVKRVIDRRGFGRSDLYWDRRYRAGGNSGAGSYGRLAQWKAEMLNAWVAEHGWDSVVEFGCGDGAQLELAEYPSYVGCDVSQTVITQCEALFAHDSTKSFRVHDATKDPMLVSVGDVSLSLDVVYHLVEDHIFEAYMAQLFDAAREAVVVYASNDQRPQLVPHVRHRRFTDWVEQHEPGWALAERVPNRYPESLDDGGETSFADFYLYVRSGSPRVDGPRSETK